MNQEIRFPAEWEPQEAIQITWPHSKEIWEDDFPQVTQLFVSISKIVISHTRLIIIYFRPDELSRFFSDAEIERIFFVKAQTNDIWSRDHGLISVYNNEKILLYNYIFNGWGMKFPANFDNQVNKGLVSHGIIKPSLVCRDVPFVFEGGSIDSNGSGEALTTAACIFSKNRNEHFSEKEIIQTIKQKFGLKRLHVLRSGFLAGDDTDSHIDMLARFVSKDTIVYATCKENDDHFEALNKMKDELILLENAFGQHFNLVGIPIGTVYNEKKRLPASYINFLIVNERVFIPFYNIEEDAEAKAIFADLFPNKEVVPINCSLLIKQGGSLHCATMNFYKGTLNPLLLRNIF